MKNKFFKKALSVFTAMAMMLSLMTGIPFSELELDITVSAASAVYDGEPVAPQQITSSNYRSFGFTESNWGQYNGYYAIRNAKELYGYAIVCAGSNTKAVLLNDIVVNETVSESGATYSWTPIGHHSYFSGEFDGNGHYISGLYFNDTSEYQVGLFGWTSEANIRNVTLKNSYLCAENAIGGIVGRMSGTTLTNCKVDSDVTIVATSADEGAVNVGGMFGQHYLMSIQHNISNFTNCTSLATVKAPNVPKRSSGYYQANMGAFCGYADYAYCEQTAGTNCFYVPNSVTGADGTSDRGAGKDDVINERLTTITIDNNGEITDTHTCVSATHSRVEPTCYSTGLTEYSYCIICGEITSGTKEEIPTVDHEYSEATCKVPKTCVYCGVTTGGTIDHIYSEATCTAPPTCIMCGLENGSVNPDNHTTDETQWGVSNNRRYHALVYKCCGAIQSNEELHKDSMENGVCSKCSYVCEHLSVTNGKCDDCGIEGDTSYVNRYWDDVNKKVITNAYALVGNVTEITSSTSTLSEGWYIVKGEVTNSNRLTVSGTVNLILADGCTLNVANGIYVPGGTTLNIYGQIQGTGKLVASNGSSGMNAAIGGTENLNTGRIVINGGVVEATNRAGDGAAIGSGLYGRSTDVEINGGVVNAHSNYGDSAAIGVGTLGSGSSTHSVTIHGGTIIASGRKYAIGNSNNNVCTVTVDGGNISGNVSGKTLTNTSGTSVSCVEITLNGATDGTIVTELEGITYGLTDVKTIGDKLYLYLPADTMPTSVTAGGNTYVCSVDGTFYQEHNWIDATCFSPKHCSQCEITEGEATSHNYEDGVCTYCGKDANGVFHIETANQLVAFAQYVELGNKDADAVLDADIDMTDVAWTPICQTVSFHDTAATDTGYSGTFDGNGHTISNLTVTGISGGTYSYGLFGTVSGTVENLGMVNYTYTMGSATDARAGSIAGQVLTGGTITNCYSVGHTVTTNSNIAGGIAGCTYGGTISNCYALNGSVSGYDTRWGGVVGDCQKDDNTSGGTVSNCYTDDTRVVSSQSGNATITKCEVKNDAAFASGEIAYLLNSSSSEDVAWYQTLGTDTYPVPNREHGTVYSVFNCNESATVYRNVNENEPHTDVNPVDNVCDECGATLHTHEWEYTVNGNTITAVCNVNGCPVAGEEITIIISASNKTYDGTAVVATVENNVDKTDYSSSIVYKDSEGNVVDEAVNPGTYTANLTVGGVTASVEFTIAKVTPTAEMFTCTSSAVYDGTEKSATVVVKDGITGAGEITNIKYYQNDIEVTPVNAGTYTVKIDVAEGDIYDAATDIEVGTFEITKANAVITWNDQMLASTGKEAELTAPTLTFIGNDNPEVELTYSYKVQGDAEYTVGLPTACGIYDVKVNVSATDNYNAAEDTMVLTITCTDADNNGICDYCGMYEAPERVDEYYQIANAGNLMWFVSQVNAGQTAIDAKLTANIDMKDIDWTAMSSFAGTFDGDGHTISNLCADEDGGDDDIADGSRCGLIQTLSEGGKVTGLTISGAQLWSANSAGAIAAVNNGTISKCIVKDSSIMLGASHGLAAIAGTNNGTITDCGAINCFLQRRWGSANNASYAIGAIAEDNNGTVSNCFSYGCRFSNTPNAYAIVESGNAPVNCYYYTGNTVSDTVATVKTADQFASGEVAYLLNGSTSENVTWYQTLETDTYPVLDSKHGIVYSVFKCDGETPAGYSNVNEPAHVYTHTVVPPTYFEQGYTLHECDNCDYSYKDDYTNKLAIAITNPSRSTTAIRINWNKIDTAIGYVIEQFDGENWVQIANITDNATVTYKVTDLTPGTAYKFRMFAYNDESRSDYTEELAVNTDMTTVKGFTSPSRSTSAIRLNWTKNAYATGYVIDWFNGAEWVQIADITDREITTYKVTGLKSGTAYKFRMKAYSVTETGGIIYGNKTATLTVNTQSSTVKGFDLKSRSSTALRLKWTKNTAVDGYIIEQMIDGVWTEIADIDDYKTTEYKVTGLEASTSYSFRMKSYSITKYGDRTYSTYTSVLDKTTNPSAVSGLRVKSRSDKAIRLAWTANTSADGYLIEQYIDGNWVQIADVADGSVTEYKVTGLASATEYQFRVRSYNMDGETALYSEYKTVSGVTL